MSGIYGILGLQDNDRSFVKTIGQRVVYEATAQMLERYNSELNSFLGWFLEGTVENFKERYKLPGGGRMGRRGRLARPDVVKAYGSWDVAYPLEDFAEGLGDDDIAMAYMTIQEYARHLETIFIRNTNRVRYEVLTRLFKNTTNTFVDPIHGSLTIQPLANGDTVVYPPVIGSASEATEDHYLESGYTVANISDTNNPLPTIRDDMEHHFGMNTGGTDIMIFVADNITPYLEDLTSFVPVEDKFVMPGDDSARIQGFGASLPGKLIGRSNGVWVSEWKHIPDNYMLAIDPAQPKPLKMRVDPSDTGLPQGLTLMAREENMPLTQASWRHRFGFGIGNRLNGVVMEVAAGGTYTIPSTIV
jgi:hypothetical protein